MLSRRPRISMIQHPTRMSRGKSWTSRRSEGGVARGLIERNDCSAVAVVLPLAVPPVVVLNGSVSAGEPGRAKITWCPAGRVPAR